VVEGLSLAVRPPMRAGARASRVRRDSFTPHASTLNFGADRRIGARFSLGLCAFGATAGERSALSDFDLTSVAPRVLRTHEPSGS
jgi:hypothetical protein